MLKTLDEPDSKENLEKLMANTPPKLNQQITYYNLAGKHSTSEKKFKKYLKKEINFYQNLSKKLGCQYSFN